MIPLFKHSIPIQIRFADIDRLNHVNNACYLSYFELGRVHYFNQVLKESIRWSENGFVLARTEINHLLPIVLTDQIFCYSRVVSIGKKSLTIANQLLKKTNYDEYIECANGLGILVAMDYKNNVSIEVPEAWKQRIEIFEGDLNFNANH